MIKAVSTKNKLLIFITVSLLILLSIIIVNSYFNEQENLEKERKNSKENIVLAYNNAVNNYEVFYKSKLNGIISQPDILDAIKAEDREELYNLVKPRFDYLKKENSDVTVLHFHKADGHTLLRVHAPEQFGDNIAQKRDMCRYVHKHKKFVSSYEAGIHLLGHRMMIPIFDNGKYLGALEIGIKPRYILNKMKENYKISGVLFAKEEDIYKKKLIEQDKLLIGDFRLDSSTLDDNDIIKDLPSGFDLTNDITIEYGSKVYDVYLLNNNDFKGDISAKLLIFNDITLLKENFTDAVLRTLFLFGILFIILIVIVKFGFEKILNRIDKANNELKNNLAVLKSHQIAMDESSIVTKSDLNGKITYANENFLKITGYKLDEVLGKSHSIVRHPENSKETFKEMWETIKAKKIWHGRLVNRGKLDDYWVDITILPILDNDNNIIEYIAVRHDITQVIKQQEKLDNIANTDSLTGLGSRYKLIEDIKNSKNPSLALINIDSFSEINDFYGHDKGDDVIIQLSSIVEEITQEYGYLTYHLQGDEFVIFSEDSDRQTFNSNISIITLEISKEAVYVGDEQIYLNFSTAVSFEDKNKILSTADMALKFAKKQNKDFVVYSDELSLNDEYRNNIEWSKKIKDAIENDRIVPVFQPIINNNDGKKEKYESLVRLIDEEGKMISPFFFLDISKKTKQYNQITKVVIQKSFDKFKDQDVEFSINLTIEDIIEQQTSEFIFDMLDRYNIGKRVVFEVVESESIKNFQQVLNFIERVKSYGCKIAIDDFGTGYSNFEYLLKLNADYIKIDGSMIKDIDTNKEAQIVVSTIVGFAKNMNIKTIAEFVENESILNKINEMGIDYSQGYHFSPPKLEL
jgi:diguanylate cyclase (GGDEF)-like protein/PAS domain S-box-containing protein